MLSVFEEWSLSMVGCAEVVLVVAVDSFKADCSCSPLPVLDPSLVFLRRLLGWLVSPTMYKYMYKEKGDKDGEDVYVHIPQIACLYTVID